MSRTTSTRRATMSLLAFFAVHAIVGVAAVFSEAAVKAAFLHRFAAYVEWPPAVTTKGAFVIGVVGASDVRSELEGLLPAVTVQQRPARVVQVSREDDLAGVMILFIGADIPAAVSTRLLAAAAVRPILLVTDTRNGLGAGAVVNFVKVGRNVRFEISLTSAERSGLRINSALLAVATRVEGVRPRSTSNCNATPARTTGATGCGATLDASLASGGAASDAADTVELRFLVRS